MSKENVETFRQGMELINSGDVEGALRLVADDVVIKALRSGVEGEYGGRDGVRKFFADNADNFEIFRTNFHDIRDLGDQVLAIGTIHVRGKGSGIETDVPTAGVATYQDGKLISWQDFRDRHLALEAVGPG